MKRALMLIAAFLISSAASADLITLEPDDVAAGTDLSSYWAGVSLRSVRYQGGGVSTSAPVIADASNRAITGTQIFRSSTGAAWGPIDNARCFVVGGFCGLQGEALVLEFAEAVSEVSMLANFKDGLSLWLFDASYNMVGRCSSPMGLATTPCYELLGPNAYYERNWRVTASSTDRNVRYAVIAGTATPGVIDAISYSVPEPTTLALLGVGLLGFAVSCRLSKRRVETDSQRSTSTKVDKSP